MGIFRELDKIVKEDFDDEDDVSLDRDEGDRDDRDIDNDSDRDDFIDDDDTDGADIKLILKHLDSVRAAADYIDKLTPGDKTGKAFDAEIALRRAIDKMSDLSDKVYKKTTK